MRWQSYPASSVCFGDAGSVDVFLKHKQTWRAMGGGDGKKTQQHSQGFPHALGFMPHIVTTDVRSDFPSPCGKCGKKTADPVSI